MYCALILERSLLSQVQKLRRECALQARPFNVHLDEQDFGNGIEGPPRVHLVNVPQNAMTIKKQVLKLFAVERPQRVQDFFQALGIAPIRSLRDFTHRNEFARQARHELERDCMAEVGSDEKRTAHRARVGLALIVVPFLNLNCVCLALHNHHGTAVRLLIGGGFPNHDIGARAFVAVLCPALLIHLL